MTQPALFPVLSVRWSTDRVNCHVLCSVQCEGAVRLNCYLFDTRQLRSWASLVAQMVKHLPAMRETWVRSLRREDPLEKETATHFSILAWKIP